jgi:hypothetical protein
MANFSLQTWYTVRKLECNGCNEFFSMSNISAASRKEEAGSEGFLCRVGGSHCLGYCGLACAGKTTQPEGALWGFAIDPFVYVVEEIGTGSGETGWLVLPLARAERRVCVNG